MRPIERKNDPLIIAGFPGVGKSYFCERVKRDDIIEIESTPYRTSKDWPNNYVADIQKAYNSQQYSYIFISCHAEVRNALAEINVPYMIVAPYDFPEPDKVDNYNTHRRMQNDYLHRYINRGASINFIYKIMLNWNIYLQSIRDDPAVKYWLINPYENIYDVLSTYEGEDFPF